MNKEEFIQMTSAQLWEDIQSNENLRNEMIAKGKIHAQQFTQQKCAEAVMNVYQKLLI